jgi:hypothetical protein
MEGSKRRDESRRGRHECQAAARTADGARVTLLCQSGIATRPNDIATRSASYCKCVESGVIVRFRF